MKRHVAAILSFMTLLSTMVTSAFAMDNTDVTINTADMLITEVYNQFDAEYDTAIPNFVGGRSGDAIDLADSTSMNAVEKIGLAEFIQNVELDFSNSVNVTSELQRYDASMHGAFGDYEGNLFTADNTALNLPENKPPVANPELVLMNPESLKDGQYTTETMLFVATRWNNVDLCYDPEGSPLTIIKNDSFPDGYMNYFEDSTGSVAGYAIQIFNAGTYPFVFAFQDIYGAASEIFAVNFNILHRGTFETIEGTLSSATDQCQYDIALDFSVADEYSIDAVRPSRGGFTVKVYNSENDIVASLGCAGPGPTQYVGGHAVIRKPEGAIGEYTYTVRVSTNSDSYVDGSTSFRLAYGPSSQRQYFFEDVTDGMDLPYYHRYRNYKQDLANYIQGIAISDQGYYYKIKATGQETVTLSSTNASFYFKVLDANSFETLFDSRSIDSFPVDGSDAYYTVAKLNFSAGETYYIVACNPSTTNYDSVCAITVGDPRIDWGQVSYTIPPQTLTANQSITFSLNLTAPEGVGLYAMKLVHRPKEVGGNIECSVRAPGAANWRSAIALPHDFDYSYDNPDAPLVNAAGEWTVRFTPRKSGYYSGGTITLSYAYDIT